MSRQGQDPHSHQNRDEQSPPQSRINPFELQDFLLPSHTPSPFLTDTSTDGIDEYNTAPPCWLAHDRDDLSVKYRGAICSFGCQQHRWQSMGPGKARETILCSRRARASHPFVPDRHRPVQPEAQWCNHAPRASERDPFPLTNSIEAGPPGNLIRLGKASIKGCLHT